MIRLNVVTEGPTEQSFVYNVLREHLASLGVFAFTRCVETSRHKAKVYRGGLLDFRRAQRDLERWMRQDQHPEVHFTTMFDLYALPKDFPKFDEAKALAKPADRVQRLEEAMAEAIPHPRFIPYIQLHEFEALVLADASKLGAVYLQHAGAIRNLSEMASRFLTPEDIDDGEQTAPSKRIIAQIPEYDKVESGTIVTQRIGLTTLRARCPHFNDWVGRLARLGQVDVPEPE